MNSPDDLLAILDRAKLGDMVATEQLLCMHRPAVIQYAQRHTPLDLQAVVSPEDICQDVLLEGFRRLGNFEAQEADAMRRWLLTITRNRIQKVIRTHRARKRDRRRVEAPGTPDDSMVAMLEELAVYERTPSQSAMNREAIAAVQQALDRLPEECGAAVRLRYVEGLSVADAATRMSRTDGSLMTLCCRALKLLRLEMCSVLSLG